jgi:hypothetical protein
VANFVLVRLDVHGGNLSGNAGETILQRLGWKRKIPYARRMRRVLLFTALLACNTDSFDGDAGTDASTDSIVGGGGDGSADAPEKDVFVKPLRYCETVDAQFCADFDVPNDAGAGFGMNATNGWMITFLSDAAAPSKPNAFGSVSPGDSGGIAALQNLQLASGFDSGLASHVTLEMNIFLPAGLPNTSQPTFAFQLGVIPSPLFTFGLAHEGPWMLERGTGSGVMQLSPQPATNEWGKLTFSIDLSSSSGAVTLDLVTSAGTSHALLPIVTEPDAGPPTFPGFLSVGAQSVGPTLVGASFLYDNVVVRWQ